MKIASLIFLIFVILFRELISENPGEPDSLKTYRLGEIVRTADGANKTILTSGISEMQYYEIQSKDASSVADLGKYIPSAMTQTNSRGETILYLRGSGERQLGLFFDGVLMNVPWDNRMDMSLLPADIIGDIRVNKGASSILYGPNILGGAVNISTVERKNEGFGAVLRMQANDANSQLISFTHDARIGKLNYLVNAGYDHSDGFLLSAADLENPLNNQRAGSKLRTNTDVMRYSMYLRGEYGFSDNTTFGVSANHIKAEKGVAPLTEGSPSDIRFWRYGDWQRTILTLNGEHKFNKNLYFRSVFWADLFDQTIDSYSDLDYKDIIEYQIDEDRTYGTRLTFDYNLSANHSLIYVFNAFLSGHSENIFTPTETVDQGNILNFEQRTMSTGFEYMGRTDDLVFKAGAAYDYNDNPQTGPFSDFRGLSSSGPAYFMGLRFKLSDFTSLYVNTSRRSRFPTMRESFSGALNKFVVNPNLKPETGILNEIGLIYKNNDLVLEFTPFASFYEDLIQRIKLSEEIDSLQRSMRINMAKAFIAGSELQFSYKPLNSYFINGFLTYMYSSGENGEEKTDTLEYKPVLSALLNLGYKFDQDIVSSIEIEYLGDQWGLDPVGNFAKIDPYVLINLRVSYKFFVNDVLAEIFIRCNNIFDKPYVSKIGLPNPGRMFSLGITTRI